MPENFALYSRFADTLPVAQMQVLADDATPETAKTERGTTYTYRWSDLTIIVSEMPAERLKEHLLGFEG
jgi:hypothetical protein